MSARAKLAPIRPRHCKPGKPLALMAKLTAAQRETLFAWLTINGGITYAKAQERIWRVWRVKTNVDQLSRFWQRYCQPRLLQPASFELDGGAFEIVIQIRRKKGDT